MAEPLAVIIKGRPSDFCRPDGEKIVFFFIYFRDHSENISGGGGFLIFASEIWELPRRGLAESWYPPPPPPNNFAKHPYMYSIALFELFQGFL